MLAGRGAEGRDASLGAFGTDTPAALQEGAFVPGEVSRIYRAVNIVDEVSKEKFFISLLTFVCGLQSAI